MKTCTKLKYSLEIKIISARTGRANEILAEDPNSLLVITFVKKNTNTKTKETIQSSKVKLNDSLIYFNLESIKFSDVKPSHDLLQVYFVIISNKKLTKLPSTTVKLKNLKFGDEREDVWTFPEQNLIFLKYQITEITERENFLVLIQNNHSSNITDDNVKMNNTYEGSTINTSFSPSKIRKQKNDPIPTENISTFITRRDSRKFTIGKSYVSPIHENILYNWNNQPYTILEARNEEPVSQNKNQTTLCEAVFVAGIPNGLSKAIDESYDFPSYCGHEECQILPALIPKVLHKYEKSDSNCKINEITASLCFPLGLKLCFFGVDNPGKSNHSLHFLTKPFKTFMNVITNELGDRYYLVIQYYYRKISVKEYEEDYKSNPIRSYINSIDEKKLEENKAIIPRLLMSEFVYLPECIALISKNPFIESMSVCLNTVIQLNYLEANNLLTHIINEVISPGYDQKVMFFVPYNPKPVEVSNVQELKILLDNFSIENILLVWLLILYEQKILFVSDEYSTLSAMSHAFISIIYPLNWVRTYIPVLSRDLIKYLESFMPFIMGIDEYLFIKAKCFIEESGQIVIVRKNSIEINGKKCSKKNVLSILGIPDIPDTVWNELSRDLKILKQSIEKNRNEIVHEKVNMTIREIFTKGMVMLMGDYRSFMCEMDVDMPLFNNEAFLLSRSKTSRLFYQEFISSLLFKQFLLGSRGEDSYKYDKNDLREDQLINPEAYNLEYFLKMCAMYSHLIESTVDKTINDKSRAKSVSSVSLTKRKSISDLNQAKILRLFSKATNLNDNYTQSSSKHVQNISTIEEEKEMEILNYFIPPYFISDPNIRYDISKIEKLINEDAQRDTIDSNCFIFPKEKIYGFDMIVNYQKKYYFNKQSVVQEKTGIRGFRRSLTITTKISNLMNIIPTQGRIDIRECLKSILTSQSLTSQIIKEVEILLNEPIGRSLMGNIVYQYKFKDVRQMLNESSFNDLTHLISYALKKCQTDEINTSVLLSKSTLCYYKLDKKKEFYVYQQYGDMMLIIFPNFLRGVFWAKWIETEMEESEVSYFKASTNILAIMLKFKIDPSFIDRVVIQRVCSKFLSEEECSMLRQDITSNPI